MFRLKKYLCAVLCFALLFSILTVYPSADDAVPTDTDITLSDQGPEDSATAGVSVAPPEVDVPAAMLMEATTGTVLFEKNAEEALPPASVTKIMTLLLTMEAIDSGKVTLDDMVSISAYAASMGGSQVFLAEGEQMRLEDLVKCTVIASANDAAVALAEYLMGSEAAFVAAMNARAQELGANTAHFENATGLDDDTVNHVMSAKDIALISRELIAHPSVLKYSSVWMDSIRDGQFTLTNTNRLIRYYDGATGLKTGSTDKAKFCITATAERNGMPLIAVIMGAPSRDARNAAAKSLFDWGYANYALYQDPGVACDNVPVLCGTKDSVATQSASFSIVLPKADFSRVGRSVSETESMRAGVVKGTVLGTVTYTVDGNVIGTADIFAAETVEKLTFWALVGRMIKIYILS